METPRAIVVADDNRDAADSLAELLTVMGHEAIAVYDGEQAVEACRRRPAALAILDVQMPVMDGIEAARRIRADGGPPPVLASLTSLTRLYGDGARHQDYWTAFDVHLAKPLRMSELADLLASVGAP